MNLLSSIPTILLAALLSGCAPSSRETVDMLEGKTVAAWVTEAEILGVDIERNVGLNTLVSAGPSIMPALTRVLERSKSTADQARAAYAMSVIAYRNQNVALVNEAVPALMKSARTEDVEVRIYSIQALAAIGKPAIAAAPVLLDLADDEDAGVRMCAVEALGRIGVTSPHSIAVLTTALSDTNPGVRLIATQAMEKVTKQ